jgi:hypothetical protein
LILIEDREGKRQEGGERRKRERERALEMVIQGCGDSEMLNKLPEVT